MPQEIIFYPSKKSKSEDKVFMGIWMKDFLSKENLNKSKFLNYESSHKFHNQFNEIIKVQSLYKKIIREIASELNKHHKINWDERSWKFLIGPWLETFIAVFFDRLNMAKLLIEQKEIDLESFIKRGKEVEIISENYKDFTSQASDPDWNEKFIFKLLYLLKTKDFKNSKIKQRLKKKSFFNFLENINYNIKNFFLKFLERIFCNNNKFVFFSPNIGNALDFLKLNIKLNQFPFYYSFDFILNKSIRTKADENLRKNIKFKLDENNFEIKILKYLIKNCIPTIYFEGFKKLKKLADRSFFPINKKVVIISRNIFRDGAYRFWVANKINSGSKLILVQHGAGYGYKKCFQNENYETDISDLFFFLGWENKKEKKIVPIGNLAVKNKKKFKISNKRNLLVLSGLLPIFKLQNVLFDIIELSDLKKEINFFFDNLDFSLFDKISIREHPTSLKKNSLKFRELIQDKSKKIYYTSLNANLEKLISEHALVITTYDSTEFYKMLARNKPCIQLFRKKYIKEEYLKDFEDLYNCGILHNDIISLSKKINEIASNPYEWWNKNLIKNKRNKFCEKFIKTSINYELIISELNRLKEKIK